MTDDDDVDLFDSFEEMETEAQPLSVGSTDSFEAGPAKTLVDTKWVAQRYSELCEESKRLDDVAREVRSLTMICRQMEDCYCRRTTKKDPVASRAEIRHLHDGSALLLITIHNVTDQLFSSWNLSVSPSPIYPQSLASCSQSISLGTIRPGVQKSFECHVAHDFCEPPVLLQMSLCREFELDGVRKVFHVEVDPILVTIWDQVQVVKEPRVMNTSFTSTIRLPNPLLDLLNGCPDLPPTPQHVFKAILNIDVPAETSQVVLAAQDFLVKVSCAKDGSSHQALTIATESSRSHSVLAEHLRLRLIVEMSKLKSRPKKGGISILAEMEAASVEGLFQSMLAAFH